MNKKKKVLIGAFVTGIVAGIIFFFVRKKIHQKKITQKEHRETMYEQHTKRVFDVTCALLAITCFGWLYLIVAFLVKVKLGSPVLFTQPRPGKDEKIFKMYKFRTMTDERDENGELLPDEVRLTSFGMAAFHQSGRTAGSIQYFKRRYECDRTASTAGAGYGLYDG